MRRGAGSSRRARSALHRARNFPGRPVLERKNNMFGTDNNESHDALKHRRPTFGQERGAQPDPSDGRDRQADWEDEIRLNHLLRGLPDAPISTNFTARVIDQVEREIGARPSSSWRERCAAWVRGFPSLRRASRLGIAAAVLMVGALFVYQYRIYARQEVARSVAEVSRVAALPGLDALMNFEAIQRLPEIPKSREVDVELLAALR